MHIIYLTIINSFTQFFIHSFVHLSIYSFIHSLTHLFIVSPSIPPIILLFIHSFLPPFTHSFNFIHSFIHPSIQSVSFNHSSIDPFIHSFIHSNLHLEVLAKISRKRYLEDHSEQQVVVHMHYVHCDKVWYSVLVCLPWPALYFVPCSVCCRHHSTLYSSTNDIIMLQNTAHFG